MRLSIDPGDAAGQNMVSVAAQAAAQAIVARHPTIERFWMEGGMSGEKVPSNLNILLGRGRGVVASATIPTELIERHLRTQPASLIELLGMYATTSLMTGARNSHASLINILPALFIATGQDVASVPESCTA